MSAYVWFLIGTFAFVTIVYFVQETETGTVREAAVSTLGVVASIGFLTVVGAAFWALI